MHTIGKNGISSVISGKDYIMTTPSDISAHQNSFTKNSVITEANNFHDKPRNKKLPSIIKK